MRGRHIPSRAQVARRGPPRAVPAAAAAERRERSPPPPTMSTQRSLLCRSFACTAVRGARLPGPQAAAPVQRRDPVRGAGLLAAESCPLPVLTAGDGPLLLPSATGNRTPTQRAAAASGPPPSKDTHPCEGCGWARRSEAPRATGARGLGGV